MTDPLVSSAITACRRMVSMGADTALVLLQLAVDELALELPINIVEEDVSVVADTRVYAINAATMRVWACEWVTSSSPNDRRKLLATNVQELDAMEQSWRRRAASTPRRRYTTLLGDQKAVGLDPMPNETTSGGYPVLRVHGSRTMTLAADGNLPRNLQSATVLVAKACLRYAIEDNLDKRIGTLQGMYAEALQREKDGNAVIGFYDVEDAPQNFPYWMRCPVGV